MENERVHAKGEMGFRLIRLVVSSMRMIGQLTSDPAVS